MSCCFLLILLIILHINIKKITLQFIEIICMFMLTAINSALEKTPQLNMDLQRKKTSKTQSRLLNLIIKVNL